MNSANPIKISLESYFQLIQKGKELNLERNYFSEKHQLQFWNSTEWLFKVMLPWNRIPDAMGDLKPKDDHHLGLVMIRAGIATTGYFHNDVMIDHKVFRAYMIRQKQGKSQIKYLKTKGKSRAGSRLRLGESERFFEEINERLTNYSDEFPIDMWGISCAKTLLPYFYSSEPAPPFAKDQENLISIPFHVQQPDFETLKKMHQKLNQIHVIFSEKGMEVFENTPLVGAIKSSPEEEDW
ncbi:hypothetical protein [Algoriphagus marinus]|uniref:hypothetical protein n=1 Tax=Algoriphagus marinus TaxID=1925762 RepID=UPI00094BAAC7|nr:hypothetical protein [Algoriphagus marinus]